MAQMIIKFSGTVKDFEYDFNSETEDIMFHDKETHTIFLGKGVFNMECGRPEFYQTLSSRSPIVVENPSREVEIELQPYSIFKYGKSFDEDRFKVYWNERQTIIWDSKEKKQVKDMNIWEYLNSSVEEEENYDEDDWW